MVLLAGVGLTACSGEQPTPSAPVSVATAGAKADVDPASGTVTLPWDRFMMTPKEWDDVVSGLNVALIEYRKKKKYINKKYKNIQQK